MKLNRIQFWLVLFILAAFSCEIAFAAECDRTIYAEETYYLMFSESVEGCFTIEKNKTPLGKKIKKILGDTTLDARTRALISLDEIAKHIQDTYLIPANTQQANAQIIYDAARKIKQSIMDNPKTPEETLKRDWQWDSADTPPVNMAGLDFKKYLSESTCAKVKVGNCDTEYQRAEDLGRSIMLIQAAIDRYTSQYREETLAERTLRRTKWDSYYDDLTFQYFWELWANNLILDYTDNRATVDGNKVGFRALPSSKLVVVHPEVNLIYNGDAVDQVDETVTVEILGFERFTFDKLGKVKNPWGVSALAAYANSPYKNQSGWTYGLLFKYDGYSLGVTNNDGETAVVLNFNLSQKVLTINDKYRRYYDEYSGALHSVK